MSEVIAIPLGAIRPVSSPFRAGFDSDSGFATRATPSMALQDDYARGFADGQAEAAARFGDDAAAADSIRQAIAQLRAEPSEELGLYIAEAVSHLVRQIVGETQITPEEIRQMTRDGVISGGMIPKTETALMALEKGTRAVTILDGKVPNACLLELFTDHGAGSQIRSTEPRVKPRVRR